MVGTLNHSCLNRKEHGKLFGRGSTDDKGPVLSWLNVIEAYQKLGEPFPVNVKICSWKVWKNMAVKVWKIYSNL